MLLIILKCEKLKIVENNIHKLNIVIKVSTNKSIIISSSRFNFDNVKKSNSQFVQKNIIC